MRATCVSLTMHILPAHRTLCVMIEQLMRENHFFFLAKGGFHRIAQMCARLFYLFALIIILFELN